MSRCAGRATLHDHCYSWLRTSRPFYSGPRRSGNNGIAWLWTYVAPRNPFEGIFEVEARAVTSPIFPQTDRLADLCRHYRVRRLSLFGSVLRGTARPDSDIDLLVEFEPTATPTLIDVAALEIELSKLAGGRRIDLRTAGDLSRYFRDQVIREAAEQYVAA